MNQLMAFLEPFTSRQNLLVRLKNDWERALEQYDAAEKELRAAAAYNASCGADGAHL